MFIMYELKQKIFPQVTDSALSKLYSVFVSVHLSIRPAVHCYNSISTQTHWCCSGTPRGLCKYQILLLSAAVGSRWEPRLSSQPESLWSDMI